MKIPCEMIVWSVLPMIRREMASELVLVHGMPQAEVARRFGVTDAAVSQYLRRKRGSGPALAEEDEAFAQFMERLRESAGRIADQGSDPAVEMCRLCGTFKRLGLLDKAYLSQTGSLPPKSLCGTVKRFGASTRNASLVFVEGPVVGACHLIFGAVLIGSYPHIYHHRKMNHTVRLYFTSSLAVNK